MSSRGPTRGSHSPILVKGLSLAAKPGGAVGARGTGRVGGPPGVWWEVGGTPWRETAAPSAADALLIVEVANPEWVGSTVVVEVAGGLGGRMTSLNGFLSLAFLLAACLRLAFLQGAGCQPCWPLGAVFGVDLG